MQFLMFRLYAPLSSWGDVAVGEFRPSSGYPGRSALIGLLGAALGIDRDDELKQLELDRSLAFAVAVYAEGMLLRDYHTVQVAGAADLKRRPHRIRADELAIPRHELNTILSTRDYRQDSLCVVGTWLREDRDGFGLDDLQGALERPRFTPYLGRKACPPSLPMSPRIVEADSFRTALATAQFPAIDELSAMKLPAQPLRVASEDQAAIGWPTSFTVSRKVAPLSCRRWQFGDRVEHVALIATMSEPGDAGEDAAP
jgi:CRISPR system Cascade subunit CasD